MSNTLITRAGGNRGMARRNQPAFLADAAGRPRCPRCGARVLVTPGGELLDPEPHPLAITLPDGGRLTARQAAAVLTGRTPPIGHHPHHADGYGCPGAVARQLALFAA
jgi:hypothetical protein